MSCIIAVESTPNPNSYKILLSYSFIGDEMWECTDFHGASESPLATSIWSLNQKSDSIRQIFFHDNMIIVSKHDNAVWADIIDEIKLKIEDHFTQNKPLFETNSTNTLRNEDKDILQLISEVIRDYIQPAVKSHGGFVQFQKLDDGVVYISMHGSCSGCPSSDITLKNGIEQIVKLYVPGINSVELI